jgi:transposase
VRALNRLEIVGETFRHALNSLAVVLPDWLRAQTEAEWVDRYGPRFLDSRLPESKGEREELATSIGADGHALLTAIFAVDTPVWVRTIPAVQTLRQAWVQNYTWTTQGTLRWRTNEELPPANQFVSTPYDLDAHYSQKRTTSWVGYKVHLSESCDVDLPHVITNVETTSAPTSDDAVTPRIHAALEQRNVLPDIHLVDTGFIDAELIVESERQYNVDLYGPVRGDYHRQAREGKGFAAQDFVIDWTLQQATCPAGKTRASWTPAIDKRTNAVIKVKFAMRDCKRCVSRDDCTTSPRRTVTIRPKEQYLALQKRRVYQGTREFKQTYGKRAGIEGTISQGVRVTGLRRARYVGAAKTHLQHLATATVINLLRVSDWLDEHPRAKTRQSRFECLFPKAA